jgi:hypothetical protein
MDLSGASFFRHGLGLAASARFRIHAVVGIRIHMCFILTNIQNPKPGRLQFMFLLNKKAKVRTARRLGEPPIRRIPLDFQSMQLWGLEFACALF